MLSWLVYQEAECEKEKMDVAYQAQTNIADSSREYQMQKASYDQEVNARKAEAELSYELQVKKILVIFIKQEINCSSNIFLVKRQAKMK